MNKKEPIKKTKRRLTPTPIGNRSISEAAFDVIFEDYERNPCPTGKYRYISSVHYDFICHILTN